MKKHLVLIILFTFSLSFSQQLRWNRDYLSISNVDRNSITFYNRSDNAIKIKIRKNNTNIYNRIIPAKSNKIFKANTVVFNKNYFDNLDIKVYYDLECYQKDAEKLNAIAKKRYRKAKSYSNWQNGLSVASGFFESIGWEKLANITGNASSLMSGYKDAKEKGLTYAGVNYIVGELQDKLIDQTVDREWLRGSIKAVKSLDDWSNDEIKIDNSDLEELALEFTKYINSNAIFNYSIDYNTTIRKYVDYDNDGIANYYDKCPNLYGTKNYGGCTKAYYDELKRQERIAKRKERRKNTKMVYADFNYSYSDMRLIDNNNSGDLVNSSFFPSITIPFLRHGFNEKSIGAFGLDISYLTGKTLLKNSSSENITLFKKEQITAGLSYLLMFNQDSRIKMILQPRFGILIKSQLSGTQIENDERSEIIDDFFIAENDNELYSENLFYYDLILRGHLNNILGFQIGARYLNNISLDKNPLYQDFHVSTDDREFKYPETSLYFFGGLNISF